ncbi:MAG: hypothetical protein AB7J40_01420 [Candidatus Altimarinota bacterium]
MRPSPSVSFVPSYDTVLNLLKDDEHRSSQQQRQLIESMSLELDQMDVVQELLQDMLLKPGVLVYFARKWLKKPVLHTPQFLNLKECLAKSYAHEVHARWNGDDFVNAVESELKDARTMISDDVDVSFENPAALLRYFQEVGRTMSFHDQLIVLLRNLTDIEALIVFLNDPEVLRVIRPECVQFFQRHQLLAVLTTPESPEQE